MVFINPIDYPDRARKEFFAKPTGLKKSAAYTFNKMLNAVCDAFPNRLWRRHHDSPQHWLSARIVGLSVDIKDITIFDNFLLSLEHRLNTTILNSNVLRFWHTIDYNMDL
jgi:hypothetical protein